MRPVIAVAVKIEEAFCPVKVEKRYLSAINLSLIAKASNINMFT